MQLLQQCLLVACGGAVGSLARFGIGIAAAHAFGKGFPWGTLIVNVAGCFAMGIVLSIIAGLEGDAKQASQIEFWRNALAIGFLGGLTTFSSFGGDTVRELQAGQPAVAVANVIANVVLCLAAVWGGMAIMRAVD
jgi:CrcB protein